MPVTPIVLIVDDYPDALDVWELYLRSAGFSVLTAADGPSALDTATRERPDVVVMDIELPGMSGFEVARALRAGADTRHIPLIAASGYSHDQQLADARHTGFDAVIVKPCDPGMLVQTIRRLLEPTSGGPPVPSGQPPTTSR